MGSENSSETSKNFPNNSLFSNEEDMSDYKGIKTSDGEEESKNSITTKTEEKENASSLNYELDNRKTNEKSNITEKSDRVSITFEWDLEGNSVYVTGSFCNWKQFFLMQKNDQGKFLLTLDLAKTIHQYKFKVDEEWKCNPKNPVCEDDDGNINNYIDASNFQKTNIKNQEDGNTDFSTTGNMSKLSQLNSSKGKSENFCSKTYNNNYSCYKPQKNELNKSVPSLPAQYKNEKNIDLNSKQSTLGEQKYFLPKENNVLSDNLSYKNINVFHHEGINHLSSKNKNQSNGNKKTISCCLSSRYRLKFTTFVYYKDKKLENNF